MFEQMDVTKAADWKRIVEKAVSLFGKLDVLVNNAGTTYRNKVFHFIDYPPFMFIACISEVRLMYG